MIQTQQSSYCCQPAETCSSRGKSVSKPSNATNRLVGETSPYLLQHAHNPVDWYPWGAQAIARARSEDLPILLSIGYSACHWCHVMERESFEDKEISEVMNSLFINIKVDREERPDLDRIYQLAHQVLTRRAGGWPLTAFLTPVDHSPLFVGTYFPAHPRHGMPGFKDLLQRVSEHYHANHLNMHDHAEAIREALKQTEPSLRESTESSKSVTILKAADQLEAEFDTIHGGFGRAPKFPHPTHLSLLLRLASTDIEGPASRMLLKTLEKMAAGGLWDQVGGGFYRYSVDDRWCIPHFEKMLYDNAQLLPLYTDAYALFDREEFRTIALETANWAITEMQSSSGGYFSTLDADSKGEEGTYYVWDEKELIDLLDVDERQFAYVIFGLDGTPNFDGRWHLNRVETIESAAEALNLSSATAMRLFNQIRSKLRLQRQTRIRPNRDEKILTSWNGLMVAAMARAGRRLNEPELVSSATRAIDFIGSHLWDGKRLLATTRLGKAHLNAYLDDYVFLAAGLLDLLQARWRIQDLNFACRLLDTVLENFRDDTAGAFYFTSNDHEQLLYRPRPLMDDAIPSGNALAARVLLAFGHLTGNENYVAAADQLLSELVPACGRYPAGACALLEVDDDRLNGLELVVIRGHMETIKHWAASLHQDYHPRRLVFAIDSYESDLPELLASRVALEQPVAYVCQGYQCEAPLVGEEAFNNWQRNR